MTHFYLTEVVWAADSDMTERLLTFRLVAECGTKADCEMQAESRAKQHDENGFDSSRDAWWGNSANLVHYYYQTTSRPGRFWNRTKPRSEERLGAERVPTGGQEEPAEGPDDAPIDRESQDLTFLDELN
jgi:hypothetical protein